MTYEYLFFDADNTLWDFNLSEKFALFKVLSEEGIDYDPDFLDIWHEINRVAWHQLEGGYLSAEDLRWVRFERFFEKIEKAADYRSVGKRYLAHLGTTDFMVPGALALLQRLHNQRRLALVTNGLKEVQRKRLQNTGIEQYFDAIVISDEIGHAKPNAEFFDYLFEQLNHPEKNKALIIGDSINSDIKGGNNYNIATCWFNPGRKAAHSGVVPKYEIHQLDDLLRLI